MFFGYTTAFHCVMIGDLLWPRVEGHVEEGDQ